MRCRTSRLSCGQQQRQSFDSVATRGAHAYLRVATSDVFFLLKINRRENNAVEAFRPTSTLQLFKQQSINIVNWGGSGIWRTPNYGHLELSPRLGSNHLKNSRFPFEFLNTKTEANSSIHVHSGWRMREFYSRQTAHERVSDDFLSLFVS